MILIKIRIFNKIYVAQHENRKNLLFQYTYIHMHIHLFQNKMRNMNSICKICALKSSFLTLSCTIIYIHIHIHYTVTEAYF